PDPDPDPGPDPDPDPDTDPGTEPVLGPVTRVGGYRSESANGASAGGAMRWPASASSGDLAVLLVSWYGNRQPLTPPGFSERGRIVINTSGGSQSHAAMFVRELNGNESGTFTVALTGAAYHNW